MTVDTTPRTGDLSQKDGRQGVRDRSTLIRSNASSDGRHRPMSDTTKPGGPACPACGATSDDAERDPAHAAPEVDFGKTFYCPSPACRVYSFVERALDG